MSSDAGGPSRPTAARRSAARLRAGPTGLPPAARVTRRRAIRRRPATTRRRGTRGITPPGYPPPGYPPMGPPPALKPGVIPLRPLGHVRHLQRVGVLHPDQPQGDARPDHHRRRGGPGRRPAAADRAAGRHRRAVARPRRGRTVRVPPRSPAPRSSDCCCPAPRAPSPPSWPGSCSAVCSRSWSDAPCSARRSASARHGNGCGDACSRCSASPRSRRSAPPC